MKRCVAALSALLCVLSATLAAAQTRSALLIGINTYQPDGSQAQHDAGCIYGRCELGHFENLEGAVNDAQAMADLLTSAKFGFPANHVALLTNPAPLRPRPGVIVLPSAETTRDGILAAMQKYIVDVPQRGDTVVFYDASHGSLRVNSKGSKLTVRVNGKLVHADSTLVPADAYLGSFDVRDREMTRIFNAALDKGIHLTVIFDSCHSGGISRGVGPKYRERALAFDARDIAEYPDTLADGQRQQAPTERNDNPALVFSAAQQDQTAKELPHSSNTEPHGAFTAALIEALQAMPASTPASVVYQRVKAVLEGGSVPDQEPDLDATAARRIQPLFGGAAADSGKAHAAALMTDEDGKVWLDTGRVSGVGIGSEFTAKIPVSGKQATLLRVSEQKGIARSTATVVSPAGAKVAPGDLFDLTKWVPAEQAPLLVWLWPSNLSQAEILAAVAQIHAARVITVSDPAEQPWTHILCWDGSNWTLQQAGSLASISLGGQLTAQALKQHLLPEAKLWVNLPPSRELAAKLLTDDPNSAVQRAPDLGSAHYTLTGTLIAERPAYAWIHKNEIATGPPAAIATDHDPGCSATSPYPVRSDWVTMAGNQAGATLNHFALLLSKVHGWLELADNSSGASTANYYTLAMQPAAGGAPLDPEQPVREDDMLKLALHSDERVIEQRWVYILDIDCHGKGALFYPFDYAENQFPNAASGSRNFVLPGARALRVGAPYGVDTLILLSTAQPLPDPAALNFEGVTSRGAQGTQSPLVKLLDNTSSGSRGAASEIPTNWGISLTTIRSIPKDAAK
ncbi:MAG: caspase family protein [Terracidiphilus sp.]